MKYNIKICRIPLITLLFLVTNIGYTKSDVCDKFVYLPSQEYAICAGATSWIFNGVTYAKCTIKTGNSASLPLNYPATSPQPSPPTLPGDVSDVNNEGTNQNLYMVSTYNPPAELTTPNGNLALYTCNKKGSYAQCDGGICFKTGATKTFPGVGIINPGEIICSCPIETTSKSYQVFGPGGDECPTTKADYDAVCASGIKASDNGQVLKIGSPTGDAKILAQCLEEKYNSPPTTITFNTCKRPKT